MDRRLARYRPPAQVYVADFPPRFPNAYWRSMAYRPQPYVEPSVYPARMIRPKDAALMSLRGPAQPTHGSRSHVPGHGDTFGAYDHLLHTSFHEEDEDLFGDEEDDFAEMLGFDDFDDFDDYGAASPAVKAAKREKRQRNWQKFKALFSKAAEELAPPAAVAPPVQHFQQAAMLPPMPSAHPAMQSNQAAMKKTTMVVGAVAVAALVGGVAWWAAKRG